MSQGSPRSLRPRIAHRLPQRVALPWRAEKALALEGLQPEGLREGLELLRHLEKQGAAFLSGMRSVLCTDRSLIQRSQKTFDTNLHEII